MTTTTTMYDSTRPRLIPADTFAALYRNGRYAADPAIESRFAKVHWIDVRGDMPLECSILDIETGDATPSVIPGWCYARHQQHPDGHLRLYCNLSTWPAVKARVGMMAPELRGLVRYWIANPTSIPHLVPGSDATQWGWGIDFDTSLCDREW